MKSGGKRNASDVPTHTVAQGGRETKRSTGYPGIIAVERDTAERESDLLKIAKLRVRMILARAHHSTLL